MPFANRRQALRDSLDFDRVDGLLVSMASNVGYLTGFSGEDASLVLTADRAFLVSDGRFTTQIAEECPDVDARIRPIGQPMPVGVAELGRELGLARLGLESHAVTIDDFQRLQDAAKGVTLEAVPGKVEALRAIKDASEIAAIREAVAYGEGAFLDLRSWLKPGVTEKGAADRLESLLRDRGATAASFPPIIAVGARAALPHARPTATNRIGVNDLILIDWGAAGTTYRSDLTRVLATGSVTPEFKAVYLAVLAAQTRAIAAIQPGVPARVIDAEARSVIDEAGFGPFFNHSVGHGIGRDVHEAPILRHLTETLLQPGMVVTVEPGVYLPGRGGIRIEDDVLVTETGCEVLSTLPKSFDSVCL